MRLNGLQWYNIHTKFCETQSTGSKVGRTQYGNLKSLLSFSLRYDRRLHNTQAHKCILILQNEALHCGYDKEVSCTDAYPGKFACEVNNNVNSIWHH